MKTKFTILVIVLILFELCNVLNAQNISTIAGVGTTGYSGDGGLAINAQLFYPYGVAVDDSGHVYIADQATHTIRKINVTTGIITTIVGGLSQPTGVFVDASHNIYIADIGTHKISKFTASTGIISTIAGGGTSYQNDVLATNAALDEPKSICVDVSGNVYIAENLNNRIRKVTVSTGKIATVVGGSGAGFSGDGGLAINAKLTRPACVFIDAVGNLYIADQNNNRIRKVTASTGIISTIAGNGTTGSSGNGGLATNASLDRPAGVTVDNLGDVYISDFNNNQIRKVTASTGIINKIAGSGPGGYCCDGLPAINAMLYQPIGVCLDASKNVYIADYWNSRIRKVNISGVGVTDLFNNQTISIYPNPSSGKFLFTHDNLQFSKNSIVEVYNAIGKKVLQQTNVNEIDLSLSPKGIYFIKISDGTMINNQRIVVQ